MKVRALQTGYDGFKRRKEGDVFDWPDSEINKAGGKIPSWVERVEKPAKSAVQQKPEKASGHVSTGKPKTTLHATSKPALKVESISDESTKDGSPDDGSAFEQAASA